MKKLLALFLTFALALAFVPAAFAEGEVEAEDIVVLYTNDVHCSVAQAEKDGTATNMGYAGVAAYKAEMKAITANVALVDCGDAIQGDAIGTLSTGRYLIDIMNKTGYDYAVYGNHEFDYGMDRLKELTKDANFKYLSCNFMDIASDPAKTVSDGYAIQEFGGKKVAFVGISTPESNPPLRISRTRTETTSTASAPATMARICMTRCRRLWTRQKRWVRIMSSPLPILAWMRRAALGVPRM